MLSMNNDLKYMKQALALAERGRHSVYPNPMVGAVIVNKERVVGKGWHERFGGPHAEINALRAAGTRARGATLYVTLEPCAHWGKTPPCADAIVTSGIQRVVYAMADPNPATTCRCQGRFSAGGIAFDGGILAREAEELNVDYLSLFKHTRTPHVITKAAMSLDGKIAATGGDSRWITGPFARTVVHGLRAAVDGILVGANTVLADNPTLTSHGAGRNPVRIAIDPSLKIPLKSNIFNDEAGTIVFYRTNKHKVKHDVLRKRGVVFIHMPQNSDFKFIIKELSKMHIYEVLIEGGGETIGRAFAAGVVDEVNFFIAPKIIGGRMAVTPVEGRGINRLAEATQLENMSVRRVGTDLLVTATVNRKRVPHVHGHH